MGKGIVGITGGSGFVGRHLQRVLVQAGYEVIIFTRSPEKQPRHEGVRYAYWNPAGQQCDLRHFGSLSAVIHLAGAGVADKRWTAARKQEIIDSRVEGTRFLVEQLRQYAPECHTLITASAIGYYGPDEASAEIPFTEESSAYNDFLGTTCKAWESASASAAGFLRRVVFRIGIVLGREGGAFPEFEKPQRMGVVPILGSGRQMVSWIHVTDLCRMFLWALEHESVGGVYNAVAPTPASHQEVMHTIARRKGGVKIPVPVPAWILNIVLGEMAVEVLKSCTVSSKKAQLEGYAFQFPRLDEAVNSLLS